MKTITNTQSASPIAGKTASVTEKKLKKLKKLKKKSKANGGGVVVLNEAARANISDLRKKLSLLPTKPKQENEAVTASPVATAKEAVVVPAATPSPVKTASCCAHKVDAADPADSEAEECKKTTSFIDLHPWPFEKKFKGVIRRRDWNALITDVQKHACAELIAENESMHTTIASLLDERDALRKRLDEIREFQSKYTREFDSRFN